MVRKNMKNSEIYTIGLNLTQNVVNANLHLPIKINFYLQKNITSLLALAEEIEKTRNEVLQKYGTINSETNAYDFEGENLEKANNELMELFELEQEVPVYMISLEDFGDVELDSNQVRAISYMIQEEEEEE